MRRVQRGMQPAPAPVLERRLRPVVDVLAAELIQDTAGRDRFQSVTPDDLYRSAEIFVRYSMTSVDVIRHTDRGDRRMFFSDLREIDRRFLRDVQMVMKLLSHFSPPYYEIYGECEGSDS